MWWELARSGKSPNTYIATRFKLTRCYSVLLKRMSTRLLVIPQRRMQIYIHEIDVEAGLGRRKS